MKSNLIFIGAPGSGKGTQSEVLSKKFDYIHISTGDLLRTEISKGTDLGRNVKSVMDKGNLVSDDLVIKLLKANLDFKKNKYIFDGFPRNIDQAKTLVDDVLVGQNFRVVYFKINEEKLIERLANRRSCSTCGKIYNLLSNKPKVEGVCDSCGSRDLRLRDDDKSDVVKNRLKVFNSTVNPMIDYFSSIGGWIEVGAELDVDLITNKIVEGLLT
jgi:adenylate kinase